MESCCERLSAFGGFVEKIQAALYDRACHIKE